MNKLCKFAAACAAVGCAFGVAAAELPDALVEYVESDGSAYYDTGICPSPANTRMVVAFAPTEVTGDNRSVFGLYSGTWADVAYVQYLSDKKLYVHWVGGKTLVESAVLNKVYLYDCHGNNATINGNTYTYSRTKTSAEAAQSLYLFGINSGGAPYGTGLPQRLYGARIYVDGKTLSANYIPCVKNGADGLPVAALYDTVSGKVCYPTAGTLTAGPAIGSESVKTFVGAADDDWQKADNWVPNGVPTKADDVIIPDGKIVATSGSIAAKSLSVAAGAMVTVGCELQGRWTVGNLFPLDGDGAPLTVDIAGDLTIAGCFGLCGKRSARENVSISVGGDLSLTGNARVCLYPGTFSCTKEGYTFAKIYASAMPVTVGSTLSVGDTSVLYPYADPVTGKAIKFSCTDFALGASATVNAEDRGWNWIKYRDDNIAGYVETTPDPRATEFGMAGGSKRYYYILPSKRCGIFDYARNSGYGGGQLAYGYAYAPFLPGSPTSCRSEPTAGGGTVWVKASNQMTVDGTVNANGYCSQYGACSGGGIWLCALKFAAGDNAKLTANGGNCSHSGSLGGGGGGRISVGVGLAPGQIDALAAGGDPTELGLEAKDGCVLCACEVIGGEGGQQDSAGVKIKGASGSVTTVYGGLADVSVNVTAVPSEIGVVTPGYGPVAVPQNSSQTFTAETRAYETANIRYACKGWVVSNATEEVARGDTTEATFNAGTKALTFYWIWGDCEKGLDINVPDHAKVVVDGVEYSETSSVWGLDGDSATFTVVPDDGYEFLCWEGEVPYGKSTSNPLVLAIADMRKVTPLVRAMSEPVTRTWLGAAKTVKLWNDPANWEPAGVPGAADDVVIANGTCLVSNYAACASLKLAGGAALKVAETASSMLEEAVLVVNGDLMMTNTATLTVAPRNQYRHGRLSVGGDLVLNGTNTLTVSAGPVDGTTFTHENGCGFVTVGGNLIVVGKSTVIPNSEPWTGGSVVFTVGGNFTLTTNAAFKANDNGFQRTSGRDPITLGPGYGVGHTTAAGYGGFGSGHNGTYGKTYGLVLTPIHPGSPSGDYQGGHPGGGLIRIHAAGKVEIAGRLDASARESDTSESSASGGGIWVTAGGRMTVLPGAVLKARGGYRCTGAGGPGGGGRIALAQMLSSAQLAAMMADEQYHGPGKANKHVFEEEVFKASHPGVGIDVLGGEDSAGEQKGSFRFVDGQSIGLMLIVR